MAQEHIFPRADSIDRQSVMETKDIAPARRFFLHWAVYFIMKIISVRREKGTAMTRLRPLFAALAVAGLPFLVGCDGPNTTEKQGYDEGVAPALSYTLSIGGGTLDVIEFIPREAPHLACIHVTPQRTWDGTAQACYKRPDDSQPLTPRTGKDFVDTYKMSSNGNTLLVTTFAPRLAPDVTCVHASPARTWSGTVISCQP
jgi:hypothetical protein